MIGAVAALAAFMFYGAACVILAMLFGLTDKYKTINKIFLGAALLVVVGSILLFVNLMRR